MLAGITFLCVYTLRYIHLLPVPAVVEVEDARGLADITHPTLCAPQILPIADVNEHDSFSHGYVLL